MALHTLTCRLGGRPGDYDYRLGYRAEEVFDASIQLDILGRVVLALCCVTHKLFQIVNTYSTWNVEFAF